MVPYFLLLSFVMFWIFLEKKSINRKAFWLPFIVLVLFSSMRSYVVGLDTGGYTADFRDQLDVSYFNFRSDVEYGFQFLHYIILKFTKNYFWLFFISSIIVLYPYLNFFKKNSKDYFLSVFIFITFGFYSFYFNGLRQGIAMAIVVLATPFLIDKKFFKFSLIVLFASLFHKSALVMILFYFIVNLRLRIEYKLIVLFVASLGLSKLLLKYLSSFNDRYGSYTEVSDEAGGYLTLLFYFIIAFYLYIHIYKYRICEEKINTLAQLYFCGLVFLLPIAMLGASASGPQRLLFYFVWPVTILLPYVFDYMKNRYIYFLFIFLSSVYFYLTTSSFSSLTPYRINEIFRIF